MAPALPVGDSWLQVTALFVVGLRIHWAVGEYQLFLRYSDENTYKRRIHSPSSEGSVGLCISDFAPSPVTTPSSGTNATSSSQVWVPPCTPLLVCAFVCVRAYTWIVCVHESCAEDVNLRS
jgi:hypothetical protein